MPTLIIWLMALIWGIIGAVFHQWHESETDNRDVDEWIRAIFFGGVAGILVVVIWPGLGLYLTIEWSLIAGYSADSFILNIVRKRIYRMLKSGKLKQIIEEIIKDVLNKSLR